MTFLLPPGIKGLKNLYIFLLNITFFKTFFSLLNICLVPVNIIVQGSSIPFPFPLFTTFSFVFTFATFLTSSLRKKTIFANLLLFSFSFLIHYCCRILIYSIAWLHLALQDVPNERGPYLEVITIIPSKWSLLDISTQVQLQILLEIRIIYLDLSNVLSIKSFMLPKFFSQKKEKIKCRVTNNGVT